MGFVTSILSKSDGSGAKSTVLKPLNWALSIMIVAFVWCIRSNIPLWVLIFLSILIGILFIVIIYTYLYCLFTDKDAIRSEKFTIQKMAIEKGILGDDLRGVLGGTDNEVIEAQMMLEDDK